MQRVRKRRGRGCGALAGIRCEKWKTHRQPLIAMVQEHYEVDRVDLAAVILYLACRNYKVLSCISYMWHARFELLAQYF